MDLGFGPLRLKLKVLKSVPRGCSSDLVLSVYPRSLYTLRWIWDLVLGLGLRIWFKDLV